jgi:hypothetical protein
MTPISWQKCSGASKSVTARRTTLRLGDKIMDYRPSMLTKSTHVKRMLFNNCANACARGLLINHNDFLVYQHRLLFFKSLSI